jgi:hypothetical protein
MTSTVLGFGKNNRDGHAGGPISVTETEETVRSDEVSAIEHMESHLGRIRRPKKRSPQNRGWLLKSD